ncbi:CehA/McbA family metallohydrolase [Acidobacteria bacterium AH-259-A15]|nr:CehA/McbA family metallohydrolase [Acidobacteria bacterium AH-259-A15]
MRKGLFSLTTACLASLFLSIQVTSAEEQVDVDKNWILVSLHLHTMDNPGYHHSPFNPNPPISYSVEGFHDIAAQARSAGVKGLVFTDHHSVGIGFDPVFSQTKDLILVLGMEWTSKDGHMNLVRYHPQSPRDILLPPDPSERQPTEPYAYPSVISEVQRRGGIAIINHPESPNHRWPENTFRADAVEVYNGPYSHISFWQRRLKESIKITAVGGSDYHSWDVFKKRPISPQRNSVVRPVNLVWTGGERSPEAILDGIRQGRVVVLSSPAAPRIFLRVDRNLDDKFEDGRQGDTLRFSRGRKAQVSMQIRVVDGAEGVLELIDRGDVFKTLPVTQSEFVHELNYTLHPDPNGFLYNFVRAQVRRDGEWAISNPIYLESAP